VVRTRIFDAVNLWWEYEPEAYVLPDGGEYLPRFFVHCRPDSAVGKRHRGAGYWIDVRRAYPSFDQSRQFGALCGGTSHHGYMFIGLPGEQHHFTANFRPSESRVCFPGFDPKEALYLSAPVSCCGPKDLTRERFGEAIDACRAARFD
jgi:hypothetical protein